MRHSLFLNASVYFIGILLLLAGCETMPPAVQEVAKAVGIETGVKVGRLPPPSARPAWPDPALDSRNQRARGEGLVAMPDLQGYLNSLYNKVKASANVPDWPGGVFITPTSELDAYSTAAGNIYLSLAWIESAESEDEVVALLSHEFGHIYLNSHALENAIVGTDQASKWLGVGVALAKKTGSVTGWTAVDTFLLSYQLGKNSFAPAWSRGDEEQADAVGATISMKLNYSFASGFKAMLERQSSWEVENAARLMKERATMLEQLKQTKAATIRNRQSGANAKPGLDDVEVSLHSGLADFTEVFANGLGEVVKKVTSTHPTTEARLVQLTAQVLPLIEGKPRVKSAVQPWRDALAHEPTNTIIRNYQFVRQAQEALHRKEFAAARRLAIQSATGATERHALPALILSLTEQYAELETATRKLQKRPLQKQRVEPLQRNIDSDADRAWKVYMMRAQLLVGAGQTAQAKSVIADGFAYFADSPFAWPEAITFMGNSEGWDKAKELARACTIRFPSYGATCSQASTSPQDRETGELQNNEKVKSLGEKLKKMF